MAQKVSIELIDDIDGKAATETVAFALDGIGYEIDLSEKNAAKVRDALAPYVGAARRMGKAPAATSPRSRAGARSGGTNGAVSNAKTVREWAKSNGHEVPERGRIPAPIQEAYAAAHAS